MKIVLFSLVNAAFSLKIGSQLEVGVVQMGQVYGRLATNLKKVSFSRFSKRVEYKDFNLKDYGCWCRGDHWQHGKGLPVDEFDEICRLQHKNYDCLQEEDPTCNVVDGLYHYNVYFDNGLVVVDCAAENDSCEMKLCKIDVEVVSRYVNLNNNMQFPDYTLNGHFGSGRGPFLPDFECPRGENHSRVKECCGTYPYRQWFLTSDEGEFANRKCCEFDDEEIQTDWNDTEIKVGRPYDSSIERCCADGVAVIGGHCG